MEFRVINGLAKVVIDDPERAEAFQMRESLSTLELAFKQAGAPLESLELIEEGGARLVEVTFTDGEVKTVNVTDDRANTILGDVMRRCPKLCGMG